MSGGRQWKTHHQVWAVITPKYGISLYASREEAKRASDPGDIVTAFHVMQEVDQKWQPLFPVGEPGAYEAALAEVHGQDPRRTYSVAEVKRIIYSLDSRN